MGKRQNQPAPRSQAGTPAAAPGGEKERLLRLLNEM